MDFSQTSKEFMEYEQSSLNSSDRREVNTRYFEEKVWPLRHNWYFIPLEEAVEKYSKRLEEAKKLSEGMSKIKPKEAAYKQDGQNLAKRLATGNDSEGLAASIFNAPFNTGKGPSYKFSGLDLEIFGIKSSSYGNCAMVEKEPIGPQVVMVKNVKGEGGEPPGFYICGLATVWVQLSYVTINRLTYIEAYYKDGKQKNGFYGYEHLVPVHNHLTMPKMKSLIREHEHRYWHMWLKENKKRLERKKRRRKK